MQKKRIVVALGHRALGTTLPEQKRATEKSARAVADLVEAGVNVVITHSNAPQVGMIHTAMNEFQKLHPDYTAAPMSVCSAMSQGYIGYDIQNSLRAELLRRGLNAAEAWLGKGPLRIEAQTYAKGFYEKFGFRQVSEEFLEDGIPHIQMLRE